MLNISGLNKRTLSVQKSYYNYLAIKFLSKKNKKSIMIGFPLAYPIEKETKNCLIVSGFLTPSLNETP